MRRFSFSIRVFLLLLTLVLWLPAVCGFMILARYTHETGVQEARNDLERRAQALSATVERELDKRVVLATALGTSRSLQDRDFAGFHDEASAVARSIGGWVIVTDASSQLLNTLVPYRAGYRVDRPSSAPLLLDGTAVRFTMKAPQTDRPAIAAFAPELHASPPRFNVAAAFEQSTIQDLLVQRAYPEGGVASVIDQGQVIVARSRDPDKWVGRRAGAEVSKKAIEGHAGFAETVTLDGVPSLTYLTPANRYGWNIVIAMPKRTLAAAAERGALQVIAASAALLAIGLVAALAFARRLARPVSQLRAGAVLLGQDVVPPLVDSGIAEIDAVSRALTLSGERSRSQTQHLQERVDEAVQQAHMAERQLMEGQKLEAIGRLTAGLAHDFNNLLQTISVSLQALQRDFADGTRQRKMLDASKRATEKAAGLVRQMLTFGRVKPLQPQSLDVAKAIMQAAELATKAVGARARLQARLDPGLPPIYVDPSLFELALLNLVFNARDAVGQGGCIVIAARAATAEEAAQAGAGRFLAVEVIDDGSGMDASTQAKAFEPYFTTKAPGAGSGIGLAHVRSFALQSGGTASIRSALGAGTTITMLLPVSTEAPSLDTVEETATAQTAPLSILMVEDDALISSVVEPALRESGHEVVVMPTAEEAQQQLAQGARFDLLFSDVVVPGSISGLDLARWVRRELPGMPVLMATGFSAEEIPPELPVLRKPYSLNTLLSRLQEVAAK